MDYKDFYFMLLFNIIILLFSQNGQAMVKLTGRKNNSIPQDGIFSLDVRSFKTRLLNATEKLRSSTTTSQLKTSKKWQIPYLRMTKRQYEIVNLLWQKTNIFINLDYTNMTCKFTNLGITADYKKQSHLHSKQNYSKTSVFIAKLPTSTPSFIEFYYLEYADDSEKPKSSPDFILRKLKKNVNSVRKDSSLPSSLKIHVNTVSSEQHFIRPQQEKSIHKIDHSNTVKTTNRPTFMNNINRTPSTDKWKSILGNDNQSKDFSLQEQLNFVPKNKTISTVTKRNINESFTKNYNLWLDLYPNDLIHSKNYTTQNPWKSVSKSTAYDRVKFFEVYDRNTPEYQNYNQSNVSNKFFDKDIKLGGSHHHDNQIFLRDVNESIGHHHDQNKTKYVKKHIQDFSHEEKKTQRAVGALTFFTRNDLNISSPKNVPFQRYSKGSRIAVWSEYPFVAVYIFEPLHVRCDAASISPHWLLAAASCLSRHERELRGGRLSAFVTFCSDTWTHPRRISYVKRTVIHPRYHPKDRLRRQLYNAGVIQVVNSMQDTCGGWAPVSLMSHQFSSGQEGSIATAVGWGLDRYEKRYTAEEIPNHSLMIYKSVVYSESCPGKIDSSTKDFNEDGITNLYCLSLPPYEAEENDTVHGALLLIGGKLLALYLQEERRPWGMQSAQYTGVWRLVPWITETAREQDDYPFQFQI